MISLDRDDQDADEIAAFGSCPAPLGDFERIVLGHGSGGRLSAELLAQVFLPAFENGILARLEDAATCPLEIDGEGGRLAFTTDAFVVRPLFFPGGDIGRLAIAGTVNDLAVSGAIPKYVSAAFVLEEGLAVADLARIVASMRETCAEAGVELVCGDTKVVDRGKGDGVFITTSGIGVVPRSRALSIASAQPGDRVVVSGTLGDHGIAVLSVREGLEFDTPLLSDCAPIGDLARVLLGACPGVRCMRDPTRGGLASALGEIAAASGAGIRLDEAALPLRPEVRAACEMLGLDPLYVASEGRLVAIVPPADADRAVAALRSHPRGGGAAIVGEVAAGDRGFVTLRSTMGGERLVTLLQGEQLPRIC